MRVEVDRDFCQGNGICAGLSPEVFEVDNDGLARVKADVVPEALRAAVADAVAGCPNAALRAVRTEQ